MKRTTRRGVQAAIAAVTVVAATIGSTGTASAQLLDDVLGDLLATVAAQLEPLQVLVDEAGGLGVFSNGTTNVVMIPAEKAGDIDAFQATLSSQLVGVIDEIRVSQFTTDALTALGDTLGSREGSGISDDYSILESYSPETDTYEIMTDAPAEVTTPLLARFPGQLSTTWGTGEAFNRYNETNPFAGAGSVRNTEGVTCTTGVNLRDASGKVYSTTAAHCYNFYKYLTNSAYQFVGYSWFKYANRDTQLIYDESVGRSGRIWSGGSATSESQIKVAGWQWPHPGLSQVYASGQTTYNAHRGSVRKTNVNFCPPKTGCLIENNAGFTYAGGTMNANGDSGGPVFTLTPTSNKAVIMGMVSGAMTDSAGKRVNVAVSYPRFADGLNFTLITE